MTTEKELVAIGFTGTREKLPAKQRKAVKETIKHIIISRPKDATYVFAHGDCVGADSYFDDLSADLIFQKAVSGKIIIYPPLEDKLRSRCELKNDGAPRVMMEPRNYLERNRRIVDNTGVLIAAPNGPEMIRSGTWSTVRYARTDPNNRILVVMPTGAVFATFMDKRNIRIEGLGV